jgi:UDP-N-acetylmuramoyl-L-alanyl-D-glutamate--2,6-diaminopimelate ligase
MAAYFDVKLSFAERIARATPGAPFAVCLDGGYGEEMLARVKAFDLTVLPVTRTASPFDLSALPLMGDYNRSNVLTAAALAVAAGVSPEEIQRQIPLLTPRWGRLEFVPCASRAKVYVDFAHTPDGLEKVCAAARGFTEGKLWVVFGAGGDRDPLKRPLMGAACEKGADRLVVTSDNPRSEEPMKIIEGILSGMAARTNVMVEPDRARAIAAALAAAEEGDTVLVCGKGHETTQEIAGVKFPFDDRDVVRAYRKF